ncbi:hypothetical protein Tco_0415583 [Tanacetum coccineum]
MVEAAWCDGEDGSGVVMMEMTAVGWPEVGRMWPVVVGNGGDDDIDGGSMVDRVDRSVGVVYVVGGGSPEVIFCLFSGLGQN